MLTYLNTFCNVRTKVLTYSQFHSQTQGFGLGPKETLQVCKGFLQFYNQTFQQNILI